MRRNRIALMMLTVLLGLFLSACGRHNLDSEESGTLTVSVINVGKGDCILIQSASHTLLLDTGYEETAGDVLSYLEARGVTRLDELIVTHFDKDHEGGAPDILAALPVGTIYLPDYEGSGKRYEALLRAVEESGARTVRLSSDTSFSADGADFRILVLGVEYDADEGNDNDMSLVMTLRYGQDSYLFAGDLEKAGIKAFLAREDEAEYDILKVPHHGGASGNMAKFLASVRPRIAIITDGEERPADEAVLDALAEIGAEVYRSSRDGTIVISGDGSGEYAVSASQDSP